MESHISRPGTNTTSLELNINTLDLLLNEIVFGMKQKMAELGVQG